MEVILKILVIYPAFWWGCSVILAGTQSMSVPIYNNLVLEGKDVMLTCYFPYNLWEQNCQWYFNQYGGEERQLTKGTRYAWSCSRISIDWVTIELSFKNATFTDTGKYTCEATTKTGVDRGELQLYVHAKPEITVPKTNYTAVSGTNVTLECIVNARGETNISTGWQKLFSQRWNNVTNSKKYFWTTRMPYLVISNVTKMDSNFYRCFASTTLVTVEGSQIYLKVQDLPLVNVQQTQYFMTSGKDVVLNCSINGRGMPIISVIWYKQSQGVLNPLTNNTRYEWKEQEPDASIRIRKATETDGGIYVCEVTTEVGSSKGKDIELRVGYNPIVTVNEYNNSIGIGDNLTLHCFIDGRGSEVKAVEWVKLDRSQYRYLQSSTRVFWDISNPSLKIINVSSDDAGKYTCRGVTEFGRTESQDISVQVFYKPTVTVNEYNYSIGIGDNLTLHCSIDGHGSEVKRVEWLKQESSQYIYVQSSTRAFWDISSPSLKIINVRLDDAGKYTCKGMTEFGTTESRKISVQVFYLPVINHQDRKDLNGSSLDKYVVPGVSVVACVALIALIVVIILIRRKRLKGRTDKPNSGIRSTNGQQKPSISENIPSGNDQAKFYVHLSEDMTYAQVIRKSNKNIDGNKSTGDTNISQSNTHIDGSNRTRDTDTSQVYMNINNTYAAVQQRSSASNSSSYIHEETESENTQVKRTEELNYTELEFSSNAQDENSGLVIRGSPSDTTYTEVVVFTR